MKNGFLIIVPMILLLSVSATSAATINAANSANGGLISGWSGSFNGASLNTLIDGVFLSQGTGWTIGTVYWFDSEDSWIEISFNNSYMIDGLIVQADDNDAYTMLEYWSEPINDWVLAWDIPNYDDYNGEDLYGMQTRPNPFDNTEQYTDFTPFLTNKIRIKAASGDNCYALSEVQAYGAPVPVTPLNPPPCFFLVLV